MHLGLSEDIDYVEYVLMKEIDEMVVKWDIKKAKNMGELFSAEVMGCMAGESEAWTSKVSLAIGSAL